MRLTKIEIKDFRAFPGPCTYAFDLRGKNLLVYGENGSGKSSLFRALVEFFNLDSRAKPFAEYKNIFSDSGLTDGHITVHFDDGQVPAFWRFGDTRPTGEARVAATALRKGCLDYRSLLRTNFLHGAGSVNLFDLVIEELLANYRLVSVGLLRPLASSGRRCLITSPQPIIVDVWRGSTTSLHASIKQSILCGQNCRRRRKPFSKLSQGAVFLSSLISLALSTIAKSAN